MYKLFSKKTADRKLSYIMPDSTTYHFIYTDFYWVLVGEILFASTWSLDNNIQTAYSEFGDGLLLRAEVPEPVTLSIFALDLARLGFHVEK